MQEGKFVHIDNYDDKKPCYCHSCGRRVTQLWENNVRSFKHIDGKSCKRYVVESGVHVSFKESFIKLLGKNVNLPRGTLLTAVCGNVEGSGDVLLKPLRVKVQGIYFEMDLRKVIPDLVLKTDKGYIYVEIVFTHGLSEEKLSKINSLCLQVSVGAMQLREWSRYGNVYDEVDIIKYFDRFPSCIKWYNDPYTEKVVKFVQKNTLVYHRGGEVTSCGKGIKNVSNVCRFCEYNVLEVYENYDIINPSILCGQIYCGYPSGLTKLNLLERV